MEGENWDEGRSSLVFKTIGRWEDRPTDVPGGGECEGNVGLADGQGGEEADEGPPVHHPHHAQPPPHRLRSLHHCTLPQIFSAIFPFT